MALATETEFRWCHIRFHFFCELTDRDYPDRRPGFFNPQSGVGALSSTVESDLMEKVVASVIVAVGTRYVVEVERELLMLRLQILEKGSELGNVEILDHVESRLSRVNERMDGFAGEVLRVIQEVRKELSRLTFGSSLAGLSGDSIARKRGRPSKSVSAETSNPRSTATEPKGNLQERQS